MNGLLCVAALARVREGGAWRGGAWRGGACRGGACRAWSARHTGLPLPLPAATSRPCLGVAGDSRVSSSPRRASGPGPPGAPRRACPSCGRAGSRTSCTSCRIGCRQIFAQCGVAYGY